MKAGIALAVVAIAVAACGGGSQLTDEERTQRAAQQLQALNVPAEREQAQLCEEGCGTNYVWGYGSSGLEVGLTWDAFGDIIVSNDNVHQAAGELPPQGGWSSSTTADHQSTAISMGAQTAPQATAIGVAVWGTANGVSVMTTDSRGVTTSTPMNSLYNAATGKYNAPVRRWMKLPPP